jgi:hypothetical protein
MFGRKSWKEKLLGSKGLPKVAQIPCDKTSKMGTGTFVVPAPTEVDSLMKKVPKGKLITINQIRQTLAKKHKANTACPMTTGIFAWMSANAAEEAKTEGAKRVTPYWRTLKTGGEINPKYPGGVEHMQSLLESEGHKVVRKGKKFLVEGYEDSLHNLD